MTEDRSALRRSRMKILLVALLFFGPALVAWILILNDWRPGGTTNAGILVQPPAAVADAVLVQAGGAPVTEELFAGRWTVAVAASGSCGEICRSTLDLVRRVHIALNKDQGRVQLGLVLPLEAAGPDLPEQGPLLLRAPAPQLELWHAAAQTPPPQVSVHIIDPRGFRILAYPAPLDGSGLLKDLRRLLRLSNEDIERFQRMERDGG